MYRENDQQLNIPNPVLGNRGIINDPTSTKRELAILYNSAVVSYHILIVQFSDYSCYSSYSYYLMLAPAWLLEELTTALANSVPKFSCLAPGRLIADLDHHLVWIINVAFWPSG
jgi:hypothetical protein